MFDDADDLAMERAYDRAVQRHRFAQAQEDRDTGHQLDPMPDFDDWVSPPQGDEAGTFRDLSAFYTTFPPHDDDDA